MSFREKLYKIIFEHDTKAGKAFDVVLLWLILISVLVVILESIPQFLASFSPYFLLIEWLFTIIFTIEYILRVWSSPKPKSYIFSIWGLIDLLAILPSILGIFLAKTHFLLLIRIFRLLRVFRILKLVRFREEGKILLSSIVSSFHKISVFFMFVLFFVIILGTLMYVVEGGENGFTSIPESIYWAIVTISTVGFGDIVPKTVIGKFLASISMILAYAIIAVPTGIITVELSKKNENKKCPKCKHLNDLNANFCNQCGEPINKKEN
jgi:voltage-gated potassium channel